MNEEWLALYGRMKPIINAEETVTEKLAQQEQIQNGEQASSCSASCDVDCESEYLPGLSLAKAPPSAQGIMLKESTITAIRNAKTFFTGAKVDFALVKGKTMFEAWLQTSKPVRCLTLTEYE